MMIYRARLVVSMGGNVISDGAVVVEGTAIVGMGTYSDVVKRFSGMQEDLGEMILLPGLINAHCHLDYSSLRDAISSQQSFTLWIQRINAIRRTMTDEDFMASISQGLEESRNWGTTSILNIESYPELMLKLPRPLLRTWWFFEMLDVRNRLDTEDVITGALSFFEERNDWLGGFGLSPHAPYTASLPLYHIANACSKKYAMPFATHLAESDEEFQMFTQSSGALFDFLQGLGRSMEDLSGETPIAYLLKNNALPPHAMLIHMNEVAETDYTLLSEANKLLHLNVVHCPGTHHYFNRRPFPMERLRSAGLSISLGTDSLASNRSLSLFEEMRSVWKEFPQLSAFEILEMVTRNPAKALQMRGQLGELKEGAMADMIAIPYHGSMESCYEAIIDYRNRVDWMLLNGQRI